MTAKPNGAWLQQVFGKNYLTTNAGLVAMIGGAIKLAPVPPEIKPWTEWFGDLVLTVAVGYGFGAAADARAQR